MVQQLNSGHVELCVRVCQLELESRTAEWLSFAKRRNFVRKMVITRRRYPTANVARQAMLTYRVGVAHPGQSRVLSVEV